MAAASRFIRMEDRARCIGAGLLLAFALTRHAPGGAIPPRVETDAHGKPCLPEIPGFHFNLSHSGKWVLCGVGDGPLGVDIERTGRDITQVAERYFSPKELEPLEHLSMEERRGRLMSIWVIKESYMKATGLGLRLPLEQLEVLPGSQPVLLHGGRATPYGIALCSFEDRDYRIGLAVRDAPDPPPYRMEIIGCETLVETLSHHRTQCSTALKSTSF